MGFEVKKTESKIEKILKVNWSYVWIFIGVGFLLSAIYSGVKLLYFMPKLKTEKADVLSEELAPQEPIEVKKSISSDELDSIIARNLFNREGIHGDQKDKEGETEEVGDKGLVKTELPLTLLGLIYGGTPYNGLVTIEQKSQSKIGSYIVGDTIEGVEAKIEEIRRDRVIFSRSGRREYLELEQKDLVRSSRKKRTPVRMRVQRKGWLPLPVARHLKPIKRRALSEIAEKWS